MAAQTIFWNRRRLRRWMMMGTEMAAKPPNRMGLRKLMGGRQQHSLRPPPEPQIRAQHFVQGLRRVHQHIVALVPLATVAEPLPEPIHLGEVTLPNFGGTRQDFGGAFKALEFNQAGEGELELIG